MLGQLGFFGIVGLALVVIVSQPGGTAPAAAIWQSCPNGDASGVTAAFAWNAPDDGATETWLDVSLGDAFIDTATQAYGPFEPAQTAYAVAGLPPGIRYFYRVQAKSGDAWSKVAEGQLQTTC